MDDLLSECEILEIMSGEILGNEKEDKRNKKRILINKFIKNTEQT
jgi:hypothetical protein